jgi:AraC family transcriptional regulator
MLQGQLSPTENAPFGQYLARQYGEEGNQFLRTSPRARTPLAIYRKSSDKPYFGPVFAPALEDGFLVAISLTGHDRQQISNGCRSSVQSYAPDSLHIRNLAEDHSVYLCSPFDFLFFHVTREALDAIARESNSGRISALSCLPGALDPIAASLARALIPALSSPTGASAFFIDHIALAINSHLAQTYGGLPVPAPRAHGRLSRAQERRAKEFLTTHSGDDVSIATVAAACGLSRSYFIKAFKESIGTTPHKWLLEHRVQQAKRLLAGHGTSIAQIAAECGFADQSHLTRVFTSALGISPGAWRRENAI